MIVPDTSAWVEYFRRTGTPTHQTMHGLIQARAEIAVTEYVVMEVLAGARSRRELITLESLMMTYPTLLLQGVAEYEAAAEVYRTCRRAGETIGNLGDCLVAVPVIRERGELLHNDSDFEAIARHSDLRLYR